MCEGKRGPIGIHYKQDYDFSIRLYDEKGIYILGLNYNTRVIDACLSSDNKYIVLATSDSIIVFDIEKKYELVNLKCNPNTLKIIKISNDNSKIACASGNIVVFYDIISGVKFEQSIHSKRIMSMDFCIDNNHLITSSIDESTKIFDLNSKNIYLQIHHGVIATYSTLSEKENTILTALKSEPDSLSIIEHSITTGICLSALSVRGHFTVIRNMLLCEKNNILIIEDLSKTYLVDYKSGVIIDEFPDSRLFRFNEKVQKISLVNNGTVIESYSVQTRKDLLEIATNQFNSYQLTEDDKRLYYIQ